MPGYNHYPWCTCGWCSGGNGGGGWPASISDCLNAVPNKTTFLDEEREAKTYLTTCWWRGATQLFFTIPMAMVTLFYSTVLDGLGRFIRAGQTIQAARRKVQTFVTSLK